MFSFLSKNKTPQCPVDEHTRLWLEYAFLWLVDQIGDDIVKNKQVILPDRTFFAFRYDGFIESLIKTAEIVATQMDVDLSEINLQLYKDNIHTVGSTTFTQMGKGIEDSLSAGLYFGKDNTGKYDIFIEQNNLHKPEKLVAVIAHGFARVILLRNKRTGNNHEFLSDISTVLYGLGIFNANCSFKYYQGFDSWGYSSMGYLKQPHWAYVMALYAYYREETSPLWINNLALNIKADFKRSEKFISANSSLVFTQQYEPAFDSQNDEVFSGNWIGEYTYGKNYTKRAGVSVPFIIQMEVVGGVVQGISIDDEFKTISDEAAYIEGFIHKDNISFKLTYPFYWKTDKEGKFVAVKEQPSHKVMYAGRFFDNRFSGNWEIKSIGRDKDGVYYDRISSGTWSMKKQP